MTYITETSKFSLNRVATHTRQTLTRRSRAFTRYPLFSARYENERGAREKGRESEWEEKENVNKITDRSDYKAAESERGFWVITRSLRTQRTDFKRDWRPHYAWPSVDPRARKPRPTMGHASR